MNSILIFTRPFVFFPFGGAEFVVVVADEGLGLCTGGHDRFVATTCVVEISEGDITAGPGGFVGTR